MEEWIGVGITSLGAVLATWVRMTNAVTKIDSRLHVLEKNEGDVKEMLRELVETMHKIELLLAEKGIK